MIKKNNIIHSLSNHLFWDVDLSDIDQDKHSGYIIKKVLQYGLFNDWEHLVAVYGIDKIADTAMGFKELDRKTASFLAILVNTPKENFLFY